MNDTTLNYKLLSNGNAVLLNGKAFCCKPTSILQIHFESNANLLDKAMAVIHTQDKCYYRTINNDCINIKASLLLGDVKIAISYSAAEIWRCEPLNASILPDGNFLIMPISSNSEELIRKIIIELDELKVKNAKLENDLSQFDERLADIMEGWDIT